jgi:hypothetical protein
MSCTMSMRAVTSTIIAALNGHVSTKLQPFT